MSTPAFPLACLVVADTTWCIFQPRTTTHQAKAGVVASSMVRTTTCEEATQATHRTPTRRRKTQEAKWDGWGADQSERLARNHYPSRQNQNLYHVATQTTQEGQSGLEPSEASIFLRAPPMSRSIWFMSYSTSTHSTRCRDKTAPGSVTSVACVGFCIVQPTTVTLHNSKE